MMGQDREPQLRLLSYEPRHQALRGGLATLLRRSSVPQQPKTTGGGANGDLKAPRISLLSHEPRRKVLTGGLSTLLRKYPPLHRSLIEQNVAGNGHRTPRFSLISHEPRRVAFRSGLKSLFLQKPDLQPLIVGQTEVGAKGGPKFTALLSSCLLHFSVLFFLLEVPFWFFLPQPTETVHIPQIVYEFHEITLPKDLPSIKPPGQGGQPGRGTHPERAPARGSTAFHHSVTVVSNPPQPDNNFQTIIQPHVNPAQKININLKLPNIVLGGSLTVPAPAPEVPPPPMKLSVPKTLNSLTIPQVTVVSMKPPDLQLPASDSPNMPAIPAPPPPPPPKPQPKVNNLQAIATLGLQATSNGATASLLSLSLNPAPETEKLVIPAGNRYGAFTISPAGNQPGSPSGYNGGSSTVGSGGPGSGGDSSTGTGSGYKGGGGGAGLNRLGVSTSGNAASAGTANGGRLSATMLAKLVYPILRPPPKNRFAMVVTAGPVGGGGLHVFGVLKGGKVYTIFLTMPQKDWILQYSTLNKADSPKSPQAKGVTLQIDFGVVPPAVEKRFDFHRPVLTAEQKKNMIILHGIIDKDGSVRDLTVYRGVQNVADQAALAAFAKWKFQPAVRSGKPVPLEILLGIPAG
jgi:Gram-negative bacterial TonB protein C-terminal